MSKKKIFILLPDGIGLRNFVYSSFAKTGQDNGWDITYWNNLPFDFSKLGFKEEKLIGKASPLTDLYKRARKEIELNNFKSQFNDSTYNYYSFKPSTKTLKQKIKNCVVDFYIKKYKNNNLSKLRERIKKSERKTAYYKTCLETLNKNRPDFVLSTNQRTVNGIAPIIAAQDMGIPTATFIFSWDNLPKATMVIETDYYMVWSDYMKEELLLYYPYVNENQIIVTGTPQFEMHFKPENVILKSKFFNENALPDKTKFICFSGDDITTSPHDPEYLHDIALAVRDLNTRGYNLGILFRRCPVDFSNRFDAVLEGFKDVIFNVSPKWNNEGNTWNSIMPLKEDIFQLASTIHYSTLVINVGSSMVFDYACFNKPCAYINYNPEQVSNKKDIHKIYKYIHFRSMPSKEAVVWLSEPQNIANQIESLLIDSSETVRKAKEWFKLINKHPVEHASNRFWESILNIVENKS